MEDRQFQELLEATREAVAHYKGERRDLRATVVPDAPAPMSRMEVRQLRDKLKVSQALFAKYLKGGLRYPEGAALRLLRVAERAPGLVFRVPPGSVGAKRRGTARRNKKPSRKLAKA